MEKLTYPTTTMSAQVDNYHGKQIADPYRWLEDTNSPETAAWIEAQNSLTFGYLNQIPQRNILRDRLTKLWDYPRNWAPLKRGGRYFQLRNTGLQNQDCLFVLDKMDEDGRMLIDPNKLSDDGTVALTQWYPSPDGKLLAYATSTSGSDWLVWHIRNVDTGEDMSDVIEWSKFSGAAWRKDSTGFYYSRYDAPSPGQDYTGANYYQKLYFHRCGEPQDHDELVYTRPDEKEWGFDAEVSDDGRFLIIHVWVGTDVRNRLFYIDLEKEKQVVELIPELDATYRFIGNLDSTLFIRTTLDTPRGKIIAIDTTEPGRSAWHSIVAETSDTIEEVRLVHGELVVMYLHDAHHRLCRFQLSGQSAGEIALPGIGAITPNGYFINLTGGPKDGELFYAFASFLFPPTVYMFDFNSGENKLIYAPPIDFDASLYVTRQVFATSKDGTRLPLFLTHRNDLKLNGENPTILYGYGGFNISMTPTFIASRLAWLEMGGVFAWAVLRGGGEFGEDWHQAGMLERKQNVFDDFIACAEELISSKVTSKDKLAMMGGSNGGLLVGAVMTQRPDLFAAAVPAVGVLDMLRFHKFTIGWAWVSEYGSSDDPEQFRTLLAYSPLHNLRQGVRYPATLITTADHDDRVVPGHSFKYAAALQSIQTGNAPVLIRVQTKAGHGVGKPTSVLIQETADIWAFLTHTLRIKDPQVLAS